MEEPLKIALIGCGGIARAHVAGYADLRKRGCRELEYVACCDLSTEAADTRPSEIAEAQESKPRVFTDVDELVASGVADAVDVCLPHWLHHEMAIRALRGGLHVMVEKPIGITVAATLAILAAARNQERHSRLLSRLGEYRPHGPSVGPSARLGLIGDVRYADIAWINSRGLDLADPRFKWRAVKLLTGGGMIMDTGVPLRRHDDPPLRRARGGFLHDANPPGGGGDRRSRPGRRPGRCGSIVAGIDPFLQRDRRQLCLFQRSAGVTTHAGTLLRNGRND